ncbi:hypothetical protein [Streptomyces odonnellii]|uniref:hypothetical protein n=1 Tax=Streptomyces odonnellii TaxID=1417980 RepID=UPI000625BB07|nr:hypothetical protein [Streptomyces odonnellii]
MKHAHPLADTAIARWLMSSSQVPSIAREDWAYGRPALLRTGVAFDAVKMPRELVHAAAASSDPATVSAALAEVLGGPVICQPGTWYYALVPPGTCAAWRSPLAVVRGEGGWLGIPREDQTEPHAVATYWTVPVSQVGGLCDPDAVAELLRVGRERLDPTTRP